MLLVLAVAVVFCWCGGDGDGVVCFGVDSGEIDFGCVVMVTVEVWK
jgi:hypothetical protein